MPKNMTGFLRSTLIPPTKHALVIGLLMLCVGSGTHAQTGSRSDETSPFPSAERDEIVVTGQRATRAENIDELVTAFTSETKNGMIARWDRRICLSFHGISEEQGNALFDILNENMRALALGLELRQSRTGVCEPSAQIILADDPNTLIGRMLQQQPIFLAGMTKADRNRFVTLTTPVTWWSIAEMRSSEGQLPLAFELGSPLLGQQRTVPGFKQARPTRLSQGSRMDLQRMIVLVDTSKLRGISTGSLAAFLTMVVAGNVDPTASNATRNSIMSLFAETPAEGQVVRRSFTAWDRSFLTGLYSGNWNVTAERKRNEIAASSRRTLSRDTIRR